MGIKTLVKKAGNKAADTVNKLSALSPEQLKHVEEQREKYLSEMPDPEDEAAEELTNKLLAVSGVEIYNAYLPQLKDLYVPIKRSVEYDGIDMDVPHNIRFFDITRWVIDKQENNIEKLINVYQVLSNEECNIALVFNRTCKKTNVYLAVTNTKNDDNNVNAENYRKRLADAVKGNFPGAEISDGKTNTTIPCLDNQLDYSVATATNIPTEKSEKFISQTIEKLLDGIVPNKISEEYTVILLATPILDVEERKLHLTDIYSAIAPYASWQTQFTYTESDATNAMAMFGVNAGVSAGVQNGVNSAVSNTQGETDSSGESSGSSETSGTTDTTGESKSTGKSNSVSAHVGYEAFGGVGASHSSSKSASESLSKAVSNSITKNMTKITSKALSSAKSVTEGVSKATNFGANFGANFARASSVTATIGKNEGITQTYTNYNIKHALEMLEEQMKRFEKGTALGMWDFAAYVLSEDQNVANNVAHSYLALTQGEESYMSHSAINLWRGDMGDKSDDAREICGYLRELRHPLFGMSPAIVEIDSDLLVYPNIVNATTALSGKELAYSLNFPQKSIAGLPVIECAEFGRNITTYDAASEDTKNIEIGSIYHMNRTEPVSVELSLQSLASHTFITGSTGSGKSNTVYQMLAEARKNDVKFLVIEPSKGEYKNVFGSDDDVRVYGTNPKLTPLLRINPFEFPDKIHVLEHIDRLVEIFNVCWPMYAAMPAVLKNAVEKAYENCGWDLAKSENEFSNDYYPTFADVARNVKTIIESSEYDSENKGAYKGSLLTRLESLTNGINGMIFTNESISDEELFDNNVIVDISRVGSSETKSLLMGMLVLKLQEHRISSDIDMNSELRHITVLEEAHNILRRTSTEQSTEGSNLLGKSVEMISNAIAEMRTYGEGFIIADQAPGLIDMAAIRNTNTKIIMRLPDQIDRELVGRAANLNEDQINELAKLPCGVAAVYQNEWVQPVLCKINHFEFEKNEYKYVQKEPGESFNAVEDRIYIAEILSSGDEIGNEILKDEVKARLDGMNIDASVKVAAMRMMRNPAEQPRMTKLAPVYIKLFPEVLDAVRTAYEESREPASWTKAAEMAFDKMEAGEVGDTTHRDIIQCAMTYYFMNILDKVDELKKWSELGGFR